MKDPVTTTCGHTFDQKAIEEWLEKKPSCPIDNKPLNVNDLNPNPALKEVIAFHLTTQSQTKTDCQQNLANAYVNAEELEAASYIYLHLSQEAHKNRDTEKAKALCKQALHTFNANAAAWEWKSLLHQEDHQKAAKILLKGASCTSMLLEDRLRLYQMAQDKDPTRSLQEIIKSLSDQISQEKLEKVQELVEPFKQQISKMEKTQKSLDQLVGRSYDKTNTDQRSQAKLHDKVERVESLLTVAITVGLIILGVFAVKHFRAQAF